MVSITAVLFYDYFLTLDDEVAEFLDNDGAEMSLTTLYRSAMHGRRRALSVRKPLHLLWNVLTNNVSVYVLFLLVGTLYYQRHVNLTVTQSRYLPIAFQIWLLVGKWHLINPRSAQRMQI